MLLYFIIIICFLLGIVLFTMTIINKGSSRAEKLVRATIIEKYSAYDQQNRDSLSKWIDDSISTANKFYIKCRTDAGAELVLSVTKGVFNSIEINHYGNLQYVKKRVVSFERIPSHERNRDEIRQDGGYYFNKRAPVSIVQFYVDCPKLNISIPADKPVEISKEEVLEYVDKILDASTENFFGLDDGYDVIQFVNNGTNYLVDIPNVERNGSFQAEVELSKIRKVIDCYFEKGNLNELLDIVFMSF